MEGTQYVNIHGAVLLDKFTEQCVCYTSATL